MNRCVSALKFSARKALRIVHQRSTALSLKCACVIKGRKGNWLLVQRRSNDTLQIFVPKGYTFVLDHLMSKDPDDLFQKCIKNYSRNPTHNHLKWTIIYKHLILSFTN